MVVKYGGKQPSVSHKPKKNGDAAELLNGGVINGDTAEKQVFVRG